MVPQAPAALYRSTDTVGTVGTVGIFRCIFLSPSLPIHTIHTSLSSRLPGTLATLCHARCRLSSVRKMVGSSMWILMMLVGTEAARVRCRGPSCRRGHRRMPLSTANSAGLRDRASPHGCRALAHAPAGRRFLVVELEQGLTNQRLAIATYHLLAAATNRTLALDDFRAGNNHYCRRPSTASACTAKIPFEALFDVNVFARRLPATAPFCLRQGMRAREFGRAQRIERRATTRVVATAESIREYAATHLASEAAVCRQSGNPSDYSDDVYRTHSLSLTQNDCGPRENASSGRLSHRSSRRRYISGSTLCCRQRPRTFGSMTAALSLRGPS